MKYNLDSLKTNMTKAVFGKDANDNQAKGLCIQCKQPALANCYSQAGIAEYAISGLCEKCFDEICKE